MGVIYSCHSLLTCLLCLFVLVGKWMMCDDLQSQYGQFNRSQLTIPPQNVHIVFWEYNQTLSDDASTKPGAKLPLSYMSIPKKTEIMPHTVNSFPNLIKDNISRPSLSTVIATPLKKSASSNFKSPVSAAQLQQPLTLLTDAKSAKRSKPSPVSAPKPRVTHDSFASASTELPYSEIMKSLNIGSSNLTILPTTSSSKTTGLAKSINKYSSKSYLDLVKPLLEKNKQKKSHTGYVPLSQRSDDSSTANQSKSRRKRVMFTKDTHSRPSTPVQPFSAASECPEGSNNPKPVKPPTKPNHRKVSLITNEKPPVKLEQSPPPPESIDDCNMPELDNILDLFLT